MAESLAGKLWDLLSPIGQKAPLTEKQLAHRKRQKRLIRVAMVVLSLAAMGGMIYAYIAVAPQRSQKEYLAGMRLMNPGQYPAAVARFDKAIAIWPQNALAYLDRGVAHRYLGQPDQAIADLNAALQIDPNLGQAHDELGILYRQRGDDNHALEEFGKSVGNKSSVEGYYELAQTYERLGQHQKAIEFYTKAIDEMVDAPYVYRARALARQNSGDTTGAIEDRRTAVELERFR